MELTTVEHSVYDSPSSERKVYLVDGLYVSILCSHVSTTWLTYRILECSFEMRLDWIFSIHFFIGLCE
jgi:hypothetical protein